MGKYLKLFNTSLEYNRFLTDNENVDLPNVSICEDNKKKVYYNGRISIKNAFVTCDQLTYNGEQQYATNIIVSLNRNILRNNIDYIVSEDNGGTNVGNYIFTLRGIGNYKDEKNGIFTINKVTPTVVAPTAKTLTYNGSNQQLVNVGSTNFGTLKYSLDNSNWSTDIPTAINAGSYTVYYKVEGDSNINDITSTYITCTIEPSIITTYNATSTSSPTNILNSTDNIASIRIDGVKQTSLSTSYTFNTLGEHTIIFTLKPDYSNEISSRIFNNCSALTSITIPDTVTSIGTEAFNGCSELTSIILGSGLTSIGNNVLYNCSRLTSITCNATSAPTITANTFKNVKTGGTLRVPAGSTGYDKWMRTGDYYLGKYNWTKVEQ